MRKIGGHVSVAGGIEHAPQRAAQINANCAQIFSGSPRVWKRADLALHNVDELFAKQKEYSVSPIFTHALYLINLASDKESLVKKSVEALIHDLKFDALIKGAGVVVHLGSHQGRGFEAMKSQLIKKIKEILKNTPDESTFLIENSAGQNGKIGSDLSEIKELITAINSPRLGWCFDTCHAFCAGYSLGATAPKVIKDLDLWQSLKCVHVNDSQGEFNQGIDRHQNLGEGLIPQDELKSFLNLPQVENIPLILEVPGFDGHGPDAKNIAILKKLVG